MFFSDNSTKIQRLAENLSSHFEEISRQRRNAYLRRVTLNYHNIMTALINYYETDPKNPSRQIIDFITEFSNKLKTAEPSIRNSSTASDFLITKPIYQSKEFFSWEMLIDSMDSILLAERRLPLCELNSKLQHAHYKKLHTLTEEFKANCNIAAFNKKKSISHIRDFDTKVPSIISGEYSISLKMTYFAGGNILSDLFLGSFEVVGALIAIAAGLIFAIPALFTDSQYFASPTFIFDATLYLINSLAKVIRSVIFPIAIIYSKYTTDSYNVFKGEARRMVDSILALAEEEKETPNNTEVPSSALTF